MSASWFSSTIAPPIKWDLFSCFDVVVKNKYADSRRIPSIRTCCAEEFRVGRRIQPPHQHGAAGPRGLRHVPRPEVHLLSSHRWLPIPFSNLQDNMKAAHTYMIHALDRDRSCLLSSIAAAFYFIQSRDYAKAINAYQMALLCTVSPSLPCRPSRRPCLGSRGHRLLLLQAEQLQEGLPRAGPRSPAGPRQRRGPRDESRAPAHRRRPLSQGARDRLAADDPAAVPRESEPSAGAELHRRPRVLAVVASRGPLRLRAAAQRGRAGPGRLLQAARRAAHSDQRRALPRPVGSRGGSDGFGAVVVAVYGGELRRRPCGGARHCEMPGSGDAERGAGHDELAEVGGVGADRPLLPRGELLEQGGEILREGRGGEQAERARAVRVGPSVGRWLPC